MYKQEVAVECYRDTDCLYQEKWFGDIEDVQYDTDGEEAILQAADIRSEMSTAEQASVIDADDANATRFVEDLKDFKEYMLEKSAILEEYKYPEIILDELELIFMNLLKEYCETPSIKNDPRADQEFQTTVTAFYSIDSDVRKKVYLQLDCPEPLYMMKRHSESHLNCAILPTTVGTEQFGKKNLFLSNAIKSLFDEPKLKKENPENIRRLMHKATSCLTTIVDEGCNSEAVEVFIAGIIMQKFDEETLYQYECSRVDEQADDLQQVLDFLRQMIQQSKEASYFRAHNDNDSVVRKKEVGNNKKYLKMPKKSERISEIKLAVKMEKARPPPAAVSAADPVTKKSLKLRRLKISKK